MMTLEIDMDKLTARRTELQAELDKLNDLITLAEKFSKPAVVQTQQPTKEFAYALDTPVQNNRNHKPTRGFTVGLRRAVLLALHTGPVTLSDLAKGLAWEYRRTNVVVSTVLAKKLCFLSETGHLQLAEEGKKQAEWYLRHREMLTYRPSAGKL